MTYDILSSVIGGFNVKYQVDKLITDVATRNYYTTVDNVIDVDVVTTGTDAERLDVIFGVSQRCLCRIP